MPTQSSHPPATLTISSATASDLAITTAVALRRLAYGVMSDPGSVTAVQAEAIARLIDGIDALSDAVEDSDLLRYTAMVEALTPVAVETGDYLTLAAAVSPTLAAAIGDRVLGMAAAR